MNKGLMYVIIFDILSAAQSVWLGSLLQGISIFNILFINFSIITIVFVGLNLLSKKNSGKLTIENVVYFVILNISTLGSWFFLYSSLQYMEPALSAVTLYGINPLATLFVSVLIFRKASIMTTPKVAVAFLTIISMIVVGITVSEGESAITSYNNSEVMQGFIFAILTGFCMAVINVVSKKIYDNGFNLYQLMSLRFFALLIFSFLMSKEISIDFQQNISAFLIIAIIGNVIPLLMLQKGISISEPSKVAYTLLLTPIFVFMFQQLDDRISLSLHSLAAISTVVILSIVGTYIDRAKPITKRAEARANG
ncbi:EamA family transporter [Hahella sp. CR1]|uniref:EamA family transporter n=1 Tax=Hahella sp. CR1 TaxID=2992807 RepID=UPI002442FA28|nr:EamA family transporter [Hahella sp. CR1]MDG9668708.1 EamA family transporter [Hahella sp. CR1]